LISLVLPYWERQAAADNAIALLAKQYAGMDLEVVIVDDGNPVPFKVPDVPLNIKVVRLPAKSEPKSPVTAWNAGAYAASGDIVVLSCVEILHEQPVLEQMAQCVRDNGPDAYVLAAAYCPDEQKWHCHSTVSVPTCPNGTGIAFCSALYKELFVRVGGYDEQYRNGAGYEDRDFIWRLHQAGAKFIHRDDLPVTHPKSGATIHWKPEDFARNRDLYEGRWLKPVTVVCLKAGTAYGSQYVNVLRDMLSRNLTAGFPGRFVCITDDPTGLDEGIEIIPLPDDLETWWGKLYMFKRGLFADGERCVFMDLDTLVIGAIEFLAKYAGTFATLRDFYHPQQLGPAIIAWEAGEKNARIWDEWEAQGKPRHPMGDLWWLNTLGVEAEILQDLFPGKFVSYKADCKPYPPKGAAVVCFHGQPKPENCGQEWVEDVWRIGGGGSAEITVVANTSSESVKANVLSACNRNLPWLDIKPEHDKQVVIVAGGPSLRDTLEELKWRVSIGQEVWACNGAAKFLNEQGIVPDCQIVIDAQPANAGFLQSETKRQFLASQVDPALFDAATDATVFHLNTYGIGFYLPTDRVAHLISSGTTVGLAAMAVAYTQGFRGLHLFGFDSSYTDNHHAYPQAQNDADKVIEVSAGGRKFKCAPWMLQQVNEFQVLAAQLAQAGVVVTVAGDGLLPHVAKLMSSTGD
jgi:uncharacterized Rossmann fold enzyme/glycosyltransferase involved in cell wall biosynthesis